MAKKKILLILDLNGTLLERVTPKHRQAANANPRCPPVPDFVLARAHAYFRPYLDAFLEGIFKHYAVAAWTSANPKNGQPMTQAIFGHYTPQLAFGWDRTHCSDVKNSFRDHSCRKDLYNVWHDPVVNREGIWNEKNTILIDDTAAKAAYTPDNGLHLPPYTVCDPNFDCVNDTSLLSLLAYLDELQHNNPPDVRTYLREHQLFHLDESGIATHPVDKYAIAHDEHLPPAQKRVPLGPLAINPEFQRLFPMYFQSSQPRQHEDPEANHPQEWHPRARDNPEASYPRQYSRERYSKEHERMEANCPQDRYSRENEGSEASYRRRYSRERYSRGPQGSEAPYYPQERYSQVRENPEARYPRERYSREREGSEANYPLPHSRERSSSEAHYSRKSHSWEHQNPEVSHSRERYSRERGPSEEQYRREAFARKEYDTRIRWKSHAPRE
ncbi:HAD-like domain-containing protein [Gaertneriomyces semiglobifer]|nr:HAD-like domain-containing protein [Gaertneriomyces semiglobifer]